VFTLPGASNASEYAPVCLPAAAAGVAHCNAIQLLNPAVNWHGTYSSVGKGGKGSGGGHGGGGGGTTFTGYTAEQIQSAYGLSAAITNFKTGSQTVAIVDAYNDPNAVQDLATYRKIMGLSSSAGGTLTQVSQTGSATYLPTDNTSWSEEISLDLDMVSAVCPSCNILLVEANSASLSDLATAVDYAATHANVVSNSYGSKEFSGETAYDANYSHPGVVITASAGDSGYGVQYPAASPTVVSVGGTTLTTATNSRGWSESVWSGTGSGCSAVEPNPGWQPKTSYCQSRTVADVAAVADPNTGVAVYDSYGEPGWMVFGGTSVASPIIASVFALAGNAGTLGPSAAQGLYSATSTSLNPVTSGANARRCKNYLCNAAYSTTNNVGSPYNGPTGNGTPNGVNSF
jgi:subtilase family serine protease